MNKNNLFFSCFFIGCLITFNSNAQSNYFQQEVNYNIDVKLDDQKHFLHGFESFEYINNSPDALTKIYIHLWANAYKNKQTALAKQSYRNRSTLFYDSSDSIRGYIDSLQFKVNGELVPFSFDSAHIDIGTLQLKTPLQSGGKITISTPFRIKIPKGIFSRMGHIDQAYQITQWYPKPAVYDKNGWHPIPYLDQGEFYSEYGTYDVKITLPKNYVVGATGDLVNGEKELEWLNQKVKETKAIISFDAGNLYPPSSNTLKTLHYHQEKVHDFAWFADKRFHVLKGEVELPKSKRKVTTWAMFTNLEPELWQKSIEYLNDAIYYYSLWNGDYPYHQVTAVDGALSAGGGMEYPNVTVIGESYDAFGLETVIMHEVGHNWFYGILGSNERDHPWMDEGLNSFNENHYIETKYPNRLFAENFSENLVKAFDLQRYKHKSEYDLIYQFVKSNNIDQPIELKSADYTQINYGTVVYGKTAIVFDYLMAYLGEEAMTKAMHAYFDKWKFKHPQPEDLQAVLEQQTGKKLDWLFNGLIKTTAALDYKLNKSKTIDDKLIVTVKNKGKINGPFSISGIKNDSIINTQWFDGFTGKQLVNFPKGDYSKLKIDASEDMPEINRSNNSLKQKGVLKKIEPLKIQFFGSINNPDKTQIFFTPILGFNNYDKLQIGAAFYSGFLPKPNWEYYAVPLFSTHSIDLVGQGGINYNYHTKTFKNIRFGVDGFRYHFINKNQDYGKIMPSIEFHFKPKNARSFYRSSIVLKSHIVKNSIAEIAETASKWRAFNELKYKLVNNQVLNPFNIELVAEAYDNQFLKLSGTLNYMFNFNEKSWIEARIFAGGFAYNNTTNPFYNIRADGVVGTNDYKFDAYFIGRSEALGRNFLGNQFTMQNGGIKAPAMGLGSTNNFLFSYNLKLRYSQQNPIGIFTDVSISSHQRVIADAGLYISLFSNLFNVYIPVLVTNNMKQVYTTNAIGFGNRIRFTLNINLISPSKIIENNLPF